MFPLCSFLATRKASRATLIFVSRLKKLTETSTSQGCEANGLASLCWGGGTPRKPAVTVRIKSGFLVADLGFRVSDQNRTAGRGLTGQP